MLKFIICLILVAGYAAAGRISGWIFNGHVATEVSPYHAQLKIINSANPQEFMGSGVLVSRLHILTAALNIVGFNQWRAGFGSLILDNLTYFEATGAVIHEDYNATSTMNNIGVIFFGNGVFPSDDKTIVPIKLPTAGDSVPNGGSGSFVSFGFQTPSGPVSSVLLAGTQTVLMDANCEQVFPIDGVFGQFCGIDLDNFSTPCAGGQGAGFVIETSDGPMAVGVVSTVFGQCDSAVAVTFYIRISDYREWLSTRFGI